MTVDGIAVNSFYISEIVDYTKKSVGTLYLCIKRDYFR